MKRHTLPTIIASMFLLLAACGDTSDLSSDTRNTQQPPLEESFFKVVQAPKTYEGGVDYEAVDKLKVANTASAFRFYRNLRPHNENLIFSPLSFSRVFAGYFGQREAAAFEALFGFTPDVATIDAWDQLFYVITDRDVEANESHSTFEASDVYWVQEDEQGNASEAAFDRVHMLDLQGDPEGSRDRINTWVEQKSGGMLVDFIEPGEINPDTQAIATNLVYFVGAWTQEYRTKMVDFKGLKGDSEKAGFAGTIETAAVVTGDVSVVRLPYASGYNHILIMPNGDFETFANQFDDVQYNALLSELSPHDVSFTIPEVRADSKPDMVQSINELREETGTQGGTLSGAYMESYKHQAAIEMTREGTRAAAVSAVIEYQNNAPEPAPPLTVTFDKPFIHMITDGYSGSILFMGEFTD